MPNDRNEVSYYPEIQRYIEEQLKSNFRLTRQRDLFVFWGIGELKTNLQRIISEHPAECECARTFANKVPPLNLDIFALVSDGMHYELLILENGASPRLSQILSTEHHLSHIQTIVDGNQRDHLLGFMTWDSLTQNFEYSNLGIIKSLSDLSGKISAEFE